MQRFVNDSKGTTLVELTVTLGVSVILMGIVSQTFLSQKSTYDVQGQITRMVQTARASMDCMTREIKMAGYDPSFAGFEGIPYNANQLTFYADLNGDGDTNDADEAIVYTYDAANLRINRDDGNGNQTLADHIQWFSFEYLQTGGTATTTTDDIRRVRLIVSARTERPDPGYGENGGYRTYTLTSTVAPKNMSL